MFECKPLLKLNPYSKTAFTGNKEIGICFYVISGYYFFLFYAEITDVRSTEPVAMATLMGSPMSSSGRVFAKM